MKIKLTWKEIRYNQNHGILEVHLPWPVVGYRNGVFVYQGHSPSRDDLSKSFDVVSLDAVPNQRNRRFLVNSIRYICSPHSGAHPLPQESSMILQVLNVATHKFNQ